MTELAPLPALQVDLVELVRVGIPLVRPFRTSFGTQRARDVLLVHVATADGVDGWGECATTDAPVYDADFTDGAALVLRDHLVPAALAGDRQLTAGEVVARVGRFRGHHAARAALEAAVWDAQLRAAGTALADHLGATRDRVPAGVSVGIPTGADERPDLATLEAQVAGYLDEGYLRVKVKIEPGFDVAPVRALRRAFGSGLRLQVDANSAYSPEDAAHRAALDELDATDLTMIEQPFAADRLRAHARHGGRWRTPVCLDESITDRWRARDAVETGACGVVNVKVGRVGGLTEAVAVHDVCRDRGVPVWCGGMLETGVGRSVNVALAALPGFVLPGDTSASARYFAEDLTEPFTLDDGHVAVPTGAGASRLPDPGRLAAWTTGRERLV